MIPLPTACQGCPLYDLNHAKSGFSRLEGTGSSGLMVVAEALGEHEERDGLPLRPQAAAGSVFARALKLAGIARESLLITNICRCRPPTNALAGTPYEFAAIEHCKTHFREALRSHPQIKVVLALGNIPHRTLTGLTGDHGTNTHLRGYVLQAVEYDDLLVIPTYHPSYILQGAHHKFRVLVEDLKRAYRLAISAGRRKRVEWVNDAGGKPIRTETEEDDGSYILNPVDDPRLRYQTDPTISEAENFYEACRAEPSSTISYDIETDRSAGQAEDESDNEALGQTPTLIQFSIEPSSGIALPWVGEYVEIARRILALPNPKVGANCWLFDNPILAANKAPVAGRIDDTLYAWHHMQPDLPADLQFVASWFGAPFPWKHYAGPNFRFYGCADADMTLRIWRGLPDAMRKVGVWDSYERYVRELRPVLDAMTKRGVAVDRDALVGFGGLLKQTIERVRREIVPLVPSELQQFKPFKGVPHDVREWVAARLPKMQTEIENWWPASQKKTKKALAEALAPQKAQLTIDGFEALGYVKTDMSTPKDDFLDCWAKPLDFNPGSWQQVMAYAKFRKHQIPVVSKKQNGMKVRAESVNEKALLQLLRKTKDPFYRLILDYREPSKMLGTYVGNVETMTGGFMPGSDGRVRADFTTRPANGQLSTRNGPPLQTAPAHGELAPAFQRCLVASPGHVLVKADYKSFHVLTLGFEAGDPLYCRLARGDMHSFFTTQLLRLESADRLIAMDDAEMRERLKWWRKKPDAVYAGPKGRMLTFQDVRDQQSKPTILGMGLGLQANRLLEENEEFIASKAVAEKLIELWRGLFPLEVKYQRDIRQIAHEKHFLMSKYGFIRWFWNVMQWNAKWQRYESGPDSEAAISHYVQNDAFGHMRDKMLALAERGWDERYWMVNNEHDALVFDCPKQYEDECIENVHRLMSEPSAVLVHPTIAPEGLSCQVEIKIGPNRAEMVEVKC